MCVVSHTISHLCSDMLWYVCSICVVYMRVLIICVVSFVYSHVCALICVLSYACPRVLSYVFSHAGVLSRLCHMCSVAVFVLWYVKSRRRKFVHSLSFFLLIQHCLGPFVGKNGGPFAGGWLLNASIKTRWRLSSVGVIVILLLDVPLWWNCFEFSAAGLVYALVKNMLFLSQWRELALSDLEGEKWCRHGGDVRHVQEGAGERYQPKFTWHIHNLSAYIVRPYALGPSQPTDTIPITCFECVAIHSQSRSK